MPYWERAAELAGHLAVTDPTAARPFKRAGNELAACYAALGQHDKAEATWLNVLARLEQDKQSDRRLVEHGIGFASRELAKSLRAQGKLHEAEAAWRRALAAFQTGPSLMHVYWISRDLASVCLETGRRSEADALYTRALEERERFTIRHSPLLSEHENQLVLNELRRDADVHGLAALVSDHVRLLESEGRVLEATSLCESVIEILSTPLSEAELARRAAMRLPERDLSQDEAELRVTEQYGSLLRLAGRDADARAAEQQALSLREVVRKERRADRRRISDRLRRAKARQRTEPPFLAAGAG